MKRSLHKKLLHALVQLCHIFCSISTFTGSGVQNSTGPLDAGETVESVFDKIADQVHLLRGPGWVIS